MSRGLEGECLITSGVRMFSGVAVAKPVRSVCIARLATFTAHWVGVRFTSRHFETRRLVGSLIEVSSDDDGADRTLRGILDGTRSRRMIFLFGGTISRVSDGNPR